MKQGFFVLRGALRTIGLLSLCVLLAFAAGLLGCGKGEEKPGAEEKEKSQPTKNEFRERETITETTGPKEKESARPEKPREEEPRQKLPVHRSFVAGDWYPGTEKELRAMLKEFFDAADASAVQPDQTIAVICPHAGYAYAGRAAVRAIAPLGKRSRPFSRILIIGPSHTGAFRGVSIGEYSAYRTPLGDAPIDLRAVGILRSCPLVQTIVQAHLREHSVDIIVPLLQYALGDAMPPIVPVVAGEIAESDVGALAAAFRRVIDRDTAVVISSDFTHYGPNYGYLPFAFDENTSKNLADLNERAFDAVASLKRETFESYLEETKDSICGREPIALLLELLPPGAKAHRLFFDTSGAVTGDYKNSVSYLAVGPA